MLECRLHLLFACLQVHIDLRAKLKEIKLDDLPLECLPDGKKPLLEFAACFAPLLHQDNMWTSLLLSCKP